MLVLPDGKRVRLLTLLTTGHNQVDERTDNGGMAEYRAFIMGLDGHIVWAIELVCPTTSLRKNMQGNSLMVTT